MLLTVKHPHYVQCSQKQVELGEKKVRKATEDPKETVDLRGPRGMQGTGPDLEAAPRERKYAQYFL